MTFKDFVRSARSACWTSWPSATLLSSSPSPAFTARQSFGLEPWRSSRKTWSGSRTRPDGRQLRTILKPCLCCSSLPATRKKTHWKSSWSQFITSFHNLILLSFLLNSFSFVSCSHQGLVGRRHFWYLRSKKWKGKTYIIQGFVLLILNFLGWGYFL